MAVRHAGKVRRPLTSEWIPPAPMRSSCAPASSRGSDGLRCSEHLRWWWPTTCSGRTRASWAAATWASPSSSPSAASSSPRCCCASGDAHRQHLAARASTAGARCASSRSTTRCWRCTWCSCSRHRDGHGGERPSSSTTCRPSSRTRRTGSSSWKQDKRIIFYFAWSLATEEQFYLLWPGVMRVASRGAPVLFMTGMLAVVISIGRPGR